MPITYEETVQTVINLVKSLEQQVAENQKLKAELERLRAELVGKKEK